MTFDFTASTFPLIALKFLKVQVVPVDVISQKQVIRIWREAAVIEQPGKKKIHIFFRERKHFSGPLSI